MTLWDRIAFEALASSVEAQLDSSLPRQVIWPRSRALESIQVVTETVKAWNDRYVAKADIANFYEAIEHSLLAVLLSTRLRLSTIIARATEALLTATMGLPRGLPQGPAGSELFASAYLLPVDEHLVAAEIEFVRYADDYYFPASSVGEGRARLSSSRASSTTWGSP